MLSRLRNQDWTPSQRVAMTGMGAAVVAVATSVIKIPTPATGGYLNLGDVTVIFLGFLLGPRAGAIAGGVGSAAADLVGGYASYAPVTLLAKGAEGGIAGWLGGPGKGIVSRIAGGLLGGVVMAAGYWLWESRLLGMAPALAVLPGNLLQGGVGAVGALILHRLFLPPEEPA